MGRLFNRNKLQFLFLPLIVFLALIYVTVKPFSIQTTATVQIDIKGTSIGTFNGYPVEREHKKQYYYLTFKNVVISKNGKKVMPEIKVKCTESQMKAIEDLTRAEHYLQFECSIFDKKNGKLVGVFQNSPWDINMAPWSGAY